MSTRPSSSSAPHQQIVPTVPSAIHALAAPTPALIDSQLPNYLLPFVLDLLKTSTSHVVQRTRKQEAEFREEGLLPPLDKGKSRATAEEEDKRIIEEETAKRVERIGLMVGGFVAEKLTLARPPLASHLDIIKFICKDLFLFVYSKQIDNLRTNHRGIFVLQSHAFPPLMSLSSCRGPAADMEAAKPHLSFPQALIQGALTRLGMNAVVTAESSGLPQCTFQIRTVKAGGMARTPSATPSLDRATPNPQQQQQQQGGSALASRPPAQASTGLGINVTQPQ